MTSISRSTKDEASHFGYSDESWSGLTERNKDLLRIIRPARQANYKVNVSVGRLAAFFEDQAAAAISMGGQFDLEPDFQRGHVWNEPQQQAYVENFLRKNASALFRFNCASIQGISGDVSGDINPYDFVCIDGLQRITALLKFQKGELEIFGGLKVEDLKDSSFDTKRLTVAAEIEVFNFVWKEELLDYYIALNSGGVVHAAEEISRVKTLRDEARSVRLAEFKNSPRRTTRRTP